MKNCFVADWHLDHGNIIKYCRRTEFMNSTELSMLSMVDRGTIPNKDLRISKESVDLMTKTILDNTISALGHGDILWVCGDVFFSRKSNRDYRAKYFRDYIKNQVDVTINVIMGNHDDSAVRKFADNVYEQKLINVDGQKIFLNHYPMRSWDCAYHGAWMLYGHVHDLYKYEDNGKVSPFMHSVYSEGFRDKLLAFSELHSLDDDLVDEIVSNLVDVVAEQNGIDLTCDIGVDNQIRGLPFGTPWTFEDLKIYFAPKKRKWEERQQRLASFVPTSKMKQEQKPFA